MALVLRGLRGLRDGDQGLSDVRISRGRLQQIGDALKPRRLDRVLDLTGYMALPGLINAHDHLDLDLLPALGTPPYESFYDWAEEIYLPNASPIREVLAVPAALRFAWGAYRNLISGVTTVIHHGDLPRRPMSTPIQILRRYGWSHSLGFSPSVSDDFKRAKGKPFFVHAAEGTDTRAVQEIEHLDTLGLLGPTTVLVHAMACADAIDRLADSGCAIVWCPRSNEWLYGATAPIDLLLKRVPILLGTDSTLSGSPTLLDELRSAEQTGLAHSTDLMSMVTSTAAQVAGLHDRGQLRIGLRADLLILKDDGKPPADTLLSAHPRDLALVLVSGQPRLATADIAKQLALPAANARIDGERRWLWGQPGKLRQKIERFGSAEVTRGPLWQRLQPVTASAA